MLMGVSFSPIHSHAQVAGVVTTPFDTHADIAAESATETKRTVGEAIKMGTLWGLTIALLETMQYFADQVAYNAAVWIASGAPGGEPLVEQRPVGDYFLYAGSLFANEVIVELAKADERFVPLQGFGVCTPPNLPALQVGIKSAFQPGDLDICGVEELRENWSGFIGGISKTITNKEERNRVMLNTLKDSFNPNVNAFSVSFGLYTDTLLGAQKEAELNFLKLMVGDSGFKPVVDFITGNVATPASLVSDHVKTQFKKPDEVAQDSATAFIPNGILLQAGHRAASIFTNTLLSELTRKIQNGLFDPIEFDDPFDEFASGTGSRDAAQERLRSILTFSPIGSSNYSLLSEFVTCPSTTRGTARRIYNCVLDASFASAISRSEAGIALTLEEAISQGLINGNWPLIPSGDITANQDPLCYTYGFCHGNLVKMRKARIIPVGWELAAESPQNGGGSYVTLREAMEGFYECNDEGGRDDNNPWCKLIDPNWVLKYPETQCRLLVHGQQLEASGVDSRAQECVDFESCVSENEDGTCNAYGHCIEEENTWTFRGDSCPAEYASCLNFRRSDGKNVSYLSATVDQSGCNASNSGCLWYQDTLTVTDESATFGTIDDVAADDAREDAYLDRVYFTSAVEPCSEGDVGCAELYRRSDTLTLNLVQNPSFEADEDLDGIPDRWTAEDTSVFERREGAGRRGGFGVIANGDLVQYGLRLEQNSFYTLSAFSGRSNDAVPGTADVILSLIGPDGAAPSLEALSISEGCTILDEVAGRYGITMNPSGADLQRFDCTFTVPGSLVSGPFTGVLRMRNTSGTVIIDDVQIEQAAAPTSYTEGYSDAAVTVEYAKLPPVELGCTGGPEDHPNCANYSAICSELDAGCTLYTPTNGNPSVSATVSPADVCDAACSGYDTYKQEPTYYEPEGQFPVYFIAETADACSAADVGCSEFTNLETEEVSYYTYLRACVTETQATTNIDSDNEAVFYTWEGSDTDGYQLRTWNLLESNIEAPSIVFESGYVEANPGAAPCTNWVSDESGIRCIDTVPDMNTDAAACDEYADIFTNPDCREFYDSAGGIHYRLWSKTVSVDNSCVSYRKTDVFGLGSDTDADGIDDGKEVCEASGGRFNDSALTCLYYGLDVQSDRCGASENGCRAYTGGQSGNSRIVFEDYVEDGTVEKWQASIGSPADDDILYSNESLAADGHSVEFSSPVLRTHYFDLGSPCEEEGGCLSTDYGDVSRSGGSCRIPFGEQVCGELVGGIFSGKTYTVTFLAKGNTTLEVLLKNFSRPDTELVFDELQLTPEWNQFTLGPIAIPDSGEWGENEAVSLLFRHTDGTENTVHVDNIVLREGEGNLYLISDSWITPAQCDATPEGALAPQFQLGCQEYTTQSGQFAYLKKFTRLCDESKVGCDAFYATHQSESPYLSLHRATCQNLDLNADGAPDTALVRTTCRLLAETDGLSFDAGSPALCDMQPGQSSCEYTSSDWLPEATIVNLGILAAHIDYGPEAAFVQADQPIYIVLNEESRCSSSGAGCKELGKPAFSADQSQVTAFETVYLKDDPERYDEILCSSDELFCEEWNSTTEGTWYFKDPGEHACEYRTGVTIGATSYDGWFRTGTSEFCYGTGTCSDSGAACVLDSDCAPSGGECVVTTGSFVIGGTESGIWRNGDAGYDGWIGMCAPEWNSCKVFEDPMDVDNELAYQSSAGEMYPFIDNDILNDDRNTPTERCNGQVSQQEGCVLFNDEADVAQNYQTSATYVASQYADEFYGERPFDLVDPIDCSQSGGGIVNYRGQQIDLCQSRCRYRTADVITFPDADDGLFQFGGSCLTNLDCPDVAGAIPGEMAEGQCNNALIDANRLQNDANRILKVTRDRVCSEWLACDEERPEWDESIGAYRSVCQLVGRYEDGAEPGFNEVQVTDSVTRVLDIDLYTARETGWYGVDYSGYALPNRFSVEHLSQENIASPFTCVNTSRTEVACDPLNPAAASCAGACERNSVKTYRLAFNAGTCEDTHGSSCTVGFCSDTGRACTNDGQCNDEAFCATGTCLERTGAACRLDEDCGGGQICDGGTCAIESGACGLDFACPGASVCNVSTAVNEGTCYNDRCLLSPEGETFVDAFSVSEVCRAYPEANSPFENKLVEQWQIEDRSAQSTVPNRLESAHVYQSVSGYEAANFCAPGETCSCSYRKIGNTGGSQYIGASGAPDVLGICEGGDFTGDFCSDEEDCGGEDGLTEYCQGFDREDTYYGLTGYCLERDTSINIEGDQNLGACITWLPVDELQGSTNIYAKAVNAGVFDDVYYCGEVRTYAIAQTAMGCSAVRGEDGLSPVDPADSITDRDNSWCQHTVVCPKGYYAIVGGAKYPAMDGTAYWANRCANSGDYWDGGRDACPYMCIPDNAFTDSGEACAELLPPSDAEGLGAYRPVTKSGDTVAKTPYHYYDDPLEFDGLVDTLESCKSYGRDLELDSIGLTDANLPWPWWDLNDSCGDGFGSCNEYAIELPTSDGTGYVDWAETFPACQSVIQVAADEADQYAIAYTNRVLGNEDYDIFPLDYVRTTVNEPFGSTRNPDEVSVLNAVGIPDPTPLVIPYCSYDDDILPPDSYDSPLACSMGICSVAEQRCSTDRDCPGDEFCMRKGDYSSGLLNTGEIEAQSYLDWYATFGYSPFVDLPPGERRGDIAGRLSQIFAVPQKIRTWVLGALGSYGPAEDIEVDADDFDDDFYWDTREENGNTVPQLRALDVENCNDSGLCPEDASHPMTINGQNEGSVIAEGGFLRATAQFFAFADPNQLPLRVVKMAWGEEDGAILAPGLDDFYLNHRGLTGGGSAQTKCDDDTGTWGTTDESCTPGFFTFRNDYTCDARDVDPDVGLPLCSTFVGGEPTIFQPCVREVDGVDACVFKPGVHVRDNWGYCAGTCDLNGDGVAEEGEGCFNASLEIGSVDDSINQCNYLLKPGGRTTDDPWTYYDGEIIVKP